LTTALEGLSKEERQEMQMLADDGIEGPLDEQRERSINLLPDSHFVPLKSLSMYRNA